MKDKAKHVSDALASENSADLRELAGYFSYPSEFWRHRFSIGDIRDRMTWGDLPAERQEIVAGFLEDLRTPYVYDAADVLLALIALHPMTSDHLLMGLAVDPVEQVRRAVTLNQSASDEAKAAASLAVSAP